MTANDPLYDADRLAEIVELDLLDAEVDPILQDVASRAAEGLGLPVSLVSVVLEDGIHFGVRLHDFREPSAS